MRIIEKKKERNKRLIAYRTAHPEMTVRAIGRIFHISHARVVQITKSKKEI
jgi:DNA-directed RNA polymerase specialized sigma subunit